MSCASFSMTRRNSGELNRWLNSIEDLLKDSRGRDAFRRFLNDGSFDIASATLKFWEILDEIINIVREGVIPRPSLQEKLRELYKYADNEVNIDAALLKKLADCFKKENIDYEVIESNLNEIQRHIVDILRNPYQLFCRRHLPQLTTRRNS